MNIKGMISNILPNQVPVIEKVGRDIKSDSSHDRDANGQQTRDEEQKKKRRPMSEVEFSVSLEKLGNLSHFKEHHWSLEVETDASGVRFVIVKDNLGTAIRRIPELELWDLSLEEQDRKGHLIRKTA